MFNSPDSHLAIKWRNHSAKPKCYKRGCQSNQAKKARRRWQDHCPLASRPAFKSKRHELRSHAFIA